jgi:hypothetical protein
VVQLLLGHKPVAGSQEDLRLVLRECHPPDHLKPDQIRWEPAPEIAC